MPCMRSRFQTEAERRRREAGVEQSMKFRYRSCRHICVAGYLWYLEVSREPRHVKEQMRYQNVGVNNGHCLGIIIISYMPEYVFSIARAGQENLCQEIVPSYAHVI